MPGPHNRKRELWLTTFIIFGDATFTEEVEDAVVGALEANSLEVAGVTYEAEDGSPVLNVFTRTFVTDEAVDAAEVALGEAINGVDFASQNEVPEEYIYPPEKGWIYADQDEPTEDGYYVAANDETILQRLQGEWIAFDFARAQRGLTWDQLGHVLPVCKVTDEEAEDLPHEQLDELREEAVVTLPRGSNG